MTRTRGKPPPRELSNTVLHSTSWRQIWVDSRLLVVGSRIVSLTLGPSFAHNLGCRCPNGSCKAILGIYTSRPFQWYKEHLNERSFDPCNCLLSFWESRRTPTPIFESVSDDFTFPSKWGCDTLPTRRKVNVLFDTYNFFSHNYNCFLFRSLAIACWLLWPDLASS
jgi:hypothetical protein